MARDFNLKLCLTETNLFYFRKKNNKFIQNKFFVQQNFLSDVFVLKPVNSIALVSVGSLQVLYVKVSLNNLFFNTLYLKLSLTSLYTPVDISNISNKDMFTLFTCFFNFSYLSYLTTFCSQYRSLTTIFPGLVWVEREIKELTNYVITGLKDTRRLLTDYFQFEYETEEYLTKSYNVKNQNMLI